MGMQKIGMGNNLGTISGPKGRGRRYFLSKSQNKYLADIVASKNNLFMGCLEKGSPWRRFPHEKKFSKLSGCGRLI
jgi:hypothetical protein